MRCSFIAEAMLESMEAEIREHKDFKAMMRLEGALLELQEDGDGCGIVLDVAIRYAGKDGVVFEAWRYDGAYYLDLHLFDELLEAWRYERIPAEERRRLEYRHDA